MLISAVGPSGVAEPSPAGRFAAFFQPFEIEQVAFAPDGGHLAYVQRSNGQLSLVLLDLATNKQQRIPVGEDKYLPLSADQEKTPARLTFLDWVNARRVVFEVNNQVAWAIDANGENACQLLDSRYFAPVKDPLSFVPKTTPGPTRHPTLAPAAIMVGAHRRMRVAKLISDGPFVFFEGYRPMSSGPSGPGRSLFDLVKVEADTGRVVDDVEVNQGTDLIVDQQGWPRIVIKRDGMSWDFDYADAGDVHWRLLDQFLGDDQWSFRRDPRTYAGHRSMPLGFDYDPKILYFASNLGRDTFGIYALDTKTKQKTDLAIEDDGKDLIDAFGAQPDPLSFDRTHRTLAGVRLTTSPVRTFWVDPDLARVQNELNQIDPNKIWEIVGWDDARDRFLVLRSSYSDPGTYCLFDGQHLDEYFQRAPAIDANALSTTFDFAIDTPDQVHLTGYFTPPARPKVTPAPLVVLCHDDPWSHARPEFNPDVQALASMGFAVLQVNYRGSSGFGLKHLLAMRDGPDAVPLADIVAALDAVPATRLKIDPRLVAIMGSGYGGYLALRAMQLYPARFRCAVAIDAPADLDRWLSGLTWQSLTLELRLQLIGRDPAQLQAISPISHPELITKPVMLVQTLNETTTHLSALSDALKKQGNPPNYLEVRESASGRLPEERAQLFAQIEEFFNVNIYAYRVKLGDSTEVH